MKLLKEMVAISKDAKLEKYEDLQEKAKKLLVGKKVKAFGPKGKGLWGVADDEIEYTISKVSFPYMDDEYSFVSMNVYLKDYNSKKAGLIYTDKTFLKNLKDILKRGGITPKIDYSEQGLQGKDYVNFDVVA